MSPTRSPSSPEPRLCETLEPGDEAVLEYELAVHRGEHAFGASRFGRERDGNGRGDLERRRRRRRRDSVSPHGRDRPARRGNERLRGRGTDRRGEAASSSTPSGSTSPATRSARSTGVGTPGRGNSRPSSIGPNAPRGSSASSTSARVSSVRRPPSARRPPNSPRRRPDGRPTPSWTRVTRRASSVSPTGGSRRCHPTATPPRVAGSATCSRLHVGPSSPARRGREPPTAIPSTRSPDAPGEAQVYLFSSFVDDEPVELLERLRTHGYAVRVVSPDVTAGPDALETRLEALDRRTRLARARATGARVVDWDLERSFGLVLSDAVGEVGVR